MFSTLNIAEVSVRLYVCVCVCVCYRRCMRTTVRAGRRIRNVHGVALNEPESSLDALSSLLLLLYSNYTLLWPFPCARPVGDTLLWWSNSSLVPWLVMPILFVVWCFYKSSLKDSMGECQSNVLLQQLLYVLWHLHLGLQAWNLQLFGLVLPRVSRRLVWCDNRCPGPSFVINMGLLLLQFCEV